MLARDYDEQLLGEIKGKNTLERFDILTAGIENGCRQYKDYGRYMLPELYESIKSLASEFSIGAAEWKKLTKKKDFLCCLLDKRTFPYTSVTSSIWCDAAATAFSREYQVRIDAPRAKGASTLSNPPLQIKEDTKEDAKDAKDAKGIAVDSPRQVPMHIQEESTQREYVTNYHDWGLLDEKLYHCIDKPLRLIRCYLQIGARKHAFYTAARCMTSPYTCHIIKTPIIATLLREVFDSGDKDATALFVYALNYAMYVLRHEEITSQDVIRNTHRYIFTLSEACSMPMIPVTHLDIRAPFVHVDMHPYLPILKGEKNHDVTLAHLMPFALQGPRRILDMKEFQHRFTLMSNSLFTNIDLRAFNGCVTGSILAPCVATNPLEANFHGCDLTAKNKWLDTFKGISRADAEFMAYLEYYYPGYFSLSDEERERATAKMQDEGQLFQPRLPAIASKNAKTAAGYNVLSDIDVAIYTKDRSIFDSYVMQIYTQMLLTAKRMGLGTLHIRKVLTITSYRYCIYGTATMRPIEIFMSDRHPVKLVRDFHFPNVRMYYDSHEVYITRSCFSALVTGIGDNYKWFSSNKIPADTLLKTVQRGYTIPLSAAEMKTLRTYLEMSTRWRIDTDNMFGFVASAHSFFMSPDGIRQGLSNLAPSVIFDDNVVDAYVIRKRLKKIKKLDRMRAPSESVFAMYLR